MGTLKELIDYIESKSGVQTITISYHNKLIFDCLTNNPELAIFYNKRVVKFNWQLKLTKIKCVLEDELP